MHDDFQLTKTATYIQLGNKKKKRRKTLKYHLTDSGWQKNKYFLMTRKRVKMSALQILSDNVISPGVWRRNKFKRETHRKLQVPFSLSNS